jgi:hypothetical protein
MSDYKTSSFVIAAILVIVSLGIGFAVGKQVAMRGMSTGSSAMDSSVFTQQNASIQGQVTKVDGRQLTIKAQNGKSITLEAAQTIYINKMPSANPPKDGVAQMKPNTDINSIELNKDVFISAVMENGKYVVSSISVLPATPAGTPPPLAPKPNSALPEASGAAKQ